MKNVREEVLKHDREASEAKNEAAENAAVKKAQTSLKPKMEKTQNKTNIAEEYFSAMFARLADAQQQYEGVSN